MHYFLLGWLLSWLAMAFVVGAAVRVNALPWSIGGHSLMSGVDCLVCVFAGVITPVALGVCAKRCFDEARRRKQPKSP